ncbi:hypothetical protein [Neptuniibacter halophilus]|uniref:hypothetical protein n=1 Tax=Neptuniibacter halophilus TaxID=651666 RepID=UPI00257391B9|nr:hypothetical protein [Neptuniibacter halophilus]
MTDQRHPDIEIYVKNCSREQIEEWLRSSAEAVEFLSSKGQIHELSLQFGSESVAVMIHEKVAGKAWTSVWFKSDKTPWEKDLDCAHAASEGLATQIRCIASGWNDGDDPDEYWKVENGNAEKIQWQN